VSSSPLAQPRSASGTCTNRQDVRLPEARNAPLSQRGVSLWGCCPGAVGTRPARAFVLIGLIAPDVPRAPALLARANRAGWWLDVICPRNKFRGDDCFVPAGTMVDRGFVCVMPRYLGRFPVGLAWLDGERLCWASDARPCVPMCLRLLRILAAGTSDFVHGGWTPVRGPACLRAGPEVSRCSTSGYSIRSLRLHLLDSTAVATRNRDMLYGAHQNCLPICGRDPWKNAAKGESIRRIILRIRTIDSTAHPEMRMGNSEMH